MYKLASHQVWDPHPLIQRTSFLVVPYLSMLPLFHLSGLTLSLLQKDQLGYTLPRFTKFAPFLIQSAAKLYSPTLTLVWLERIAFTQLHINLLLTFLLIMHLNLLLHNMIHTVLKFSSNVAAPTCFLTCSLTVPSHQWHYNNTV